jgi:hypothetical protein
MTTHHGEILEKILRQKSVNITSLAKDINVSKQSVYNWFDAMYLSDEKWEMIGKAIDYDFSKDIPTLANPFKGSPQDIKRMRLEEEFEHSAMSQKISLNIELNGDDRLLQLTINKLKVLNEALKSI